MPIDPARAVGAQLPTEDFSWSASDVLLYHLALGAGGDPVDPRELRYVIEDGLQVLPTFAVVAQTVHRFEPPAVEYPGISIDLAKVLHGTQRIDVHRPLPADGKARATARVKGVYDKGSAAVVETETLVTDLDGAPLWTNTSSIFARGEGGFGGDRGPKDTWAKPDRDADHVVTYQTRPEQALVYRLSGDRNPLHVDPKFAARGGFDRPILHGLCTYGFTGRALLHTLCASDPARFRSMDARFTSPVLPGDALTVSMWVDGDTATFRTAKADGTVVIDRGRFTFAA